MNMKTRKSERLCCRILAAVYLTLCFSLLMPVMSWSETAGSAHTGVTGQTARQIGADTQTAGAFPVKIEHALGVTTILHEPKRIVTLGWGGEDVIVALGKTPVGMPRRYFLDSGILPWVEERLHGQTPVLLDFNAIDLEAIAVLKPDLILAVNSAINEKEYAQLSRIAPTVARPPAATKALWREQTEIIGIALGQHERALDLLKVTDQVIQDLANRHPDLQGKSITLSMNWFGGRGIHIYLPPHPGVEVLSQLGMQPSGGVLELASARPGQSASTIGIENTRLVEADIVAMWADRDAAKSVIKQPLLQNLDVMKRGAFILFDDPVTMWALDRPGVLSIPYAFPDIADRLSKAIRQAEP